MADGELAVSGYRGGRLDWTDFSLNRAPTQTETRTVEVIPSRVRFPGMPDRRFWSAEDRQVNFGELDVQPERVAQLVVSEFSVVFGDDWFSVPLSVPRGSLVRVLSVELIDAFGAVTSVPSYRVVDRDRPPTWDLWTLRGDTDLNPWHLVPAALSSPHEGSPIERVRLWRDEHSNRALVCEERSARAVGGHRTPQPVAPASSERSGWVFTLTPTPPVNWWPFDLQSREDSVQVDFRLTRFAGQGEPLTAAVTELEGVAISEDLLHLPQVVTRRWQLARRASGQRVLWLGRERRSTREPVVGRPLTYDNVEWIEP